MESHLHIHCVHNLYIQSVHKVQSQTSDFSFMLLSIIFLGSISKHNNNASVTKIVHLKVRDIT